MRIENSKIMFSSSSSYIWGRKVCSVFFLVPLKCKLKVLTLVQKLYELKERNIFFQQTFYTTYTCCCSLSALETISIQYTYSDWKILCETNRWFASYVSKKRLIHVQTRFFSFSISEQINRRKWVLKVGKCLKVFFSKHVKVVYVIL